jgi:outer membrane protein OmpA-like peptidoglycan-associated protein
MASLRMSGRQKKASTARALAFLVAIASGLGGCSWSDANPVEWYRHLSGADKNDVADKDQRNEINLEAGSQEPYPNLGTVPGPPERAISTVDLDKLKEGLAADRKNAEYSDAQVRQGNPVPPLPGKAPPTSAVLAQNSEAAPGQAAATPSHAQSPAAQPHSPPAKGTAAPPQESSLVSPSIPNPPQGQMPAAAPPPPTGVQPAREQAAAPAAPARAAAPAPMPPVPQQMAALPPLPPALPPPGPVPGVMQPGRHGAVSLQAGEIRFGPDGKTLSPQDEQRLAEVARLQKQGGGSVRIIAYGRRAFGADAAREELSSFSAALDRANLVAQALTRLGVPARRITVQAAPEELAGVPAGEAQILLDY